MSSSRCPQSQVAPRFALTAIFRAVPAFGQSGRAQSFDESWQLAIARSGRVTSTNAQVRASRAMAVSAARMIGRVITAPLLSMFVIPAAYLLMHLTGAARAARVRVQSESLLSTKSKGKIK
ncbi:MAG: hypothetical protein A3G80_10340 [Betaproteobacteria bacterium RIFCSPLOWO2_12_FULL_62_13b]|nr:MAG: hypothetical protein A3G80_10340 [Betaproteobacteria bacterium RIFCSPLOWO2_12_FULL_62_13b]